MYNTIFSPICPESPTFGWKESTQILCNQGAKRPTVGSCRDFPSTCCLFSPFTMNWSSLLQSQKKIHACEAAKLAWRFFNMHITVLECFDLSFIHNNFILFVLNILIVVVFFLYSYFLKSQVLLDPIFSFSVLLSIMNLIPKIYCSFLLFPPTFTESF